jgi:predicted RecA/RadA family phage recombinase
LSRVPVPLLSRLAGSYVQPGDHVTVTAPAALSSGDPVLIESPFGIAQADAESGSQVVIATQGVWTLGKVTTDVFALGDPVYYDDSVKSATADDTDVLIGIAVQAVGNPSVSVNVKINALPAAVPPA